MEAWKQKGNSAFKAGNLTKAVECYNQALRWATKEADVVILLLNRCHARNSSRCFDSALEDAKAVLDLSPDNEKALFRAARALYGLRRFQESHEYLNLLIRFSPKNHYALKDLQRCKARLREETGRYGFGAMIDEAVAKLPAPDMDRANYIGPIELRPCEIESHGRGMFAKRAIRAGELLLVEKAFATAFPDAVADDVEAQYDPISGLRTSKDLPQLHQELAIATSLKLHKNPSLAAAFMDLYPGPDAVEELDENGSAIVQDSSVYSRIKYNAFAFPILSKDFHWRAAHDPSTLITEPNDPSGSIGIFLRASYINHTCYPSVRRSFIGDMMIWRAQQNVPADTELKFGYISGIEDYDHRQTMLKKYGFICTCSLCVCEKSTPSPKTKARKATMTEIITLFEYPTSTSLSAYITLLDKLEATYIFPARAQPRREMITPLINLLNEAARTRKKPFNVLDLGGRLLRACGFLLEITPTTFCIKEWGWCCDDIVVVLTEMWNAYGKINPALGDDVEECAKVAYEILVGERESFEDAYGGVRPERVEGMEGVNFMEMVGGLEVGMG